MARNKSPEKMVELSTWRSIYLLALQQNWFRYFSQLFCEKWSPPPTCFLFIVDTTIEQHPHSWQFPCQSRAHWPQHLHHRWGWQTFVPCWHSTKALDLCECKHCPRLLLFSCWQPAELLRESRRRGGSLGSRRCPSLLLGGPATPC